MRLDKLLGELGYGSRNQVKKMIKMKQITVDNQIVLDASRNVDPSIQEVRVGSKLITYHQTIYYLMNKPQGVVTAKKDKNFQTVLDLLKETDKRADIYPIGRLDRDTEGLILLTNNGPLGYRMLHPSHHVDKTYRVTVNGFLDEDAVPFFQAGVVFLDGTVCKPADLTILSSSENESEAFVTIREGRFHQIKKMFLSYGVKVISLKRISFGPFAIEDSLLPGDYRLLTAEEKEQLKQFLD
ncbi:pseudouridine synthase [Streptococcus sp. CSL10205-OR2]|uniref:pseudouridine synthase n=1 Tax=Streptococcus sp. CSL10205-OR2 TaxID=2980558 RepID=UPI0021D8E452|nr:pseudouridine synthase [Streptococcus sp. CSL10205-OR2]MCU9533703.1 rRNA pseudouridine synthase [Streptococcus sp. CSL10205-OR2]